MGTQMANRAKKTEKKKRKMKSASIKNKGNCLKVSLPLTSQGKFRCKKRTDCQDFGEGFAPKTETITEDAYLEWQIGYDTPVNGEKETCLNKQNFSFIGANKKEKYPYELSEILYHMCINGIISKLELEQTLTAIASETKFFQDEYKIVPEKAEPLPKNGITFLRSYTKLPTFILEDEASQLQIEIMIQKQQYATGIQPMVYLDVPVQAFENSDKIIDHTSTETPNGNLIFDASKKNLVLTLLKCFGMCSKSHNHDIQEILKVILNNI